MKVRMAMVLLLLLALGGTGWSQTTLTGVAVRGNLRVEEGLILQRVGSRAGEPYSVEQVREDIRAIYQLGYFENIEVELSEAGRLTFLVLERPTLREWTVEGVDYLDQEEVNQAVTLAKRDFLDERRLQAGADAILDLFRDRGYYLARVTYEVVPIDDGKNQVDVVYRGESGEKVRVKSLNLMGIEQLDADDLRGFLLTTEAGAWSWMTASGKFKDADLERDREVIRAYYLNQGYIDVEVGEPLINLTRDRKWIKIDIPVREGRAYQLGEVRFSGDLEFEHDELERTVQLASGDVFSSDAYRAAVEGLTDLYGDIGYAFVDVDPRTRRHPENQLVDLDFHIRKGELVHIGRIEVRGNTKTRDRILRREMRLDEGELYRGSALRRSERKLNNLDFFEVVNVSTHRRPGTDLVDIDIQVEEKATGTFSFGAGYSSVDKVIGMASVSQRNFLGRAYQLAFEANFGSTSESYSVTFNNPRVFDSQVYAGTDVYKTAREYLDYDKDAVGFALKLGTALSEDWRTRWIYRWEEADIKNVDPDSSQLLLDEEGLHVTSSITPTLTYDTRDNPWDPSSGAKLDLSVEWAGAYLGGHSAFLKYDADASHYFPALWDHVFLLHGSIGFIQPLRDKRIPIYERYLLGGINTLRGFSNRSIGPEDEDSGDMIGGDKMLLFNAEYIVPLIPEAKLKGVLFFDAGNAWALGEEYLETRLRRSAGGGIRWFSPMGPLRLEYGYILDRMRGEGKSKWEFSVGGYF